MDAGSGLNARVARLAEAFIENLSDGERTRAAITADAVFERKMRSDTLPIAKTTPGQEFCDVIGATLSAAFPGGVRHDTRCIVASDTVAVVESESFAVHASGRPYNNYFAWILHFEGEKVSRCIEYTDFLYIKEVVFDA